MPYSVKMQDKIEFLLQMFSGFLNQLSGKLAESVLDGDKISNDRIDLNQPVFYNLSFLTAELETARNFYQHAFSASADETQKLMSAFLTGEACSHFRNEVSARYEEFHADGEFVRNLFSDDINAAIQNLIARDVYLSIAKNILEADFSIPPGGEHEEIFRTYRRIADEIVKPHAERVHRNDEFIPEVIISTLAENGAFGLSIPDNYGGFLDTFRTKGMLIATEELSRASLSIAGSLITRPEITARAVLGGGTEEQKSEWLPRIAAGERMCAVAVTEPDFGSDVAGMKFSAKKENEGWILNGVKTWCTFAGYADSLLVLARTDSNPASKHKGLSLFIAEKPRYTSHKFTYDNPQGGNLSGSSIATIGYRGMHSYELTFENFFVPDKNLIGGNEGLGKGFYFQMEGFSGGRIQTAARALGVMQAALEEAVKYSRERSVFGKPVSDYTLTAWKIARMASLIQAIRLYTYHAGDLLDRKEGSVEATLIKFYASRISEWVTREAMQIHGGMGYAEEYPVSRYFLDARVFSIFEGAEEVMALRVCARDILSRALK